MSKASARHAKRGVDNRKFAAKLKTRKELNIERQEAARLDNLAKLEALGVHRKKGETPSAALRRAYREINDFKQQAFAAALEAARVQHESSN